MENIGERGDSGRRATSSRALPFYSLVQIVYDRATESLIEKRSLAEIVDGALRLLRKHPRLLFGIALTYYGLPRVLGLLFTSAASSGADDDFSASFGLGLFSSLAGYCSAWCLFQIGMGNSPGFLDAVLSPLRINLRGLFCVLAASFLTAVGLTTSVVLWLVLWPLLLPLVPLLAVEGGQPGCFLRALRLGESHRLRALGVIATIVLVSFPFALTPVLLLGTSSAISAVAGTLTNSAVGAFSDAAVFLFYIDLRVRKEAFDLEHLANLAERRVSPDTSLS